MTTIRLALFLCFAARGLFAAKPLEIYFIDVDHGNAVLVVSPSGESMLLDSGPSGHIYTQRILETMHAAGAQCYRAEHEKLTASSRNLVAAALPCGTGDRFLWPVDPPIAYPWAMATSIPNENPGHELDMVTLFSSMNHDAEMEALEIHTLLDANGIESAVVGPSTLPSVEFQVQVPRALLEQAERVMAEAREAGPDAADEAEAEQETAGPSGE